MNGLVIVDLINKVHPWNCRAWLVDEHARNGVHVNAIEGFWVKSNVALKVLIHVSPKHMAKYLGEFEYRYNLRKTHWNHVFSPFGFFLTIAEKSLINERLIAFWQVFFRKLVKLVFFASLFKA